MAIQDEITRLQNAKNGIASQIEVLGAEVPSTAKLDEYPSLMNGAAASILTELQKLTYSNEITLTTSWSNNTQTVACTGITSLDTPILDINISGISQEEKYNNEWNKIIDAQTIDGSIVFYASEPTTFNLKVLVKGK